MVIGGERFYGNEKSWINDIEVVSMDPSNDTVPECLQNLNAFPANAISGYNSYYLTCNLVLIELGCSCYSLR